MLQLDAYGGYGNPSLALQASGCDEENGGWYYDLRPGEEYSTPSLFHVFFLQASVRKYLYRIPS